MGAKHLAAALMTALALVLVTGCAPEIKTAPPGHSGLGAPGSALPPLSVGAPVRPFAVGVRTITLARGLDRPLPTTVWYPAAIGTVGLIARRNAYAATGRFPLVLFSHGLSGLPQRYAGLAQSWAAAGFIVAAPIFPHTNGRIRRVLLRDIDNQAADAAYVIDRLRLLDTTPGDPLNGRVDADRVAAVGHSAGGYTTTAMFRAGHDPRLVAGVVIAGWLAPGAFAGSPANLLFVHGARDTVVPVGMGRAAYDRVPWSKSFLLLKDRWHSEYLRPGRPGFTWLRAIVANFLRWTLYGDESAHVQMPQSSFPADESPSPVLQADVAPAALRPAGR
jgi:dienelactone hydrolase